MYRQFIDNHVLANVAFLLVLIMGVTAYSLMPRQQDPTVNFNWIEVVTTLPGAAPRDVETRITDPLERAIRQIDDIRFVSSSSSESVSRILVRFEDIPDDVFREHVADLRREVRSQEDELPEDAEDPEILEITSANAFPAANVLVTAPGGGEYLRRQASVVKREIEQVDGVDQVQPIGLHDPEMRVEFDPMAVEDFGLSPTDLAATVRGYFQDLSAGQENIVDQAWLVRVEGTSPDPAELGSLPVITAAGEVSLDTVADVTLGTEEPSSLARFRGEPAVVLGITKQAKTNTLELVDRLRGFIEERNKLRDRTGIELVLADDKTQVTRDALGVMQSNLLIGLVLVMIVAWLFLGTGISLLLVSAIPFILAATFWLLWGTGETLNVTVLLGVVIALGMIVDANVVVVESIYFRLARGAARMRACLDGVREVFAPVSASVATTIAAFLPLMLMPGVLGQFMYVVPFVVTLALVASLVEAYWMLPAHVVAMRPRVGGTSRVDRVRQRWLRRIRSRYTLALAWVLRRPKRVLLASLALFMVAMAAVVTERGVRWDFFAFDPLPTFYVNVEMPAGTPLEKTLAKVEQVEARTREHLGDDEARSVVPYAGQMYTDSEIRRGNQYGQVLVALTPRGSDGRTTNEIVDDLRGHYDDIPGTDVSLLQMSGGPPQTRPISVKVRGDDFAQIRAAAADLRERMNEHPHIRDVVDDDELGMMQLDVSVDAQRAQQAGILPAEVARAVRLMVDGEVVTDFQHAGEQRDVRVLARRDNIEAIDAVLDLDLPNDQGEAVPLSELVDLGRGPGMANIRHHDFVRAITVEADIEREEIDSVSANDWVRSQWQQMRDEHPGVTTEFGGLLEDIEESLDSMLVLGLAGIGLIYLILGTQFRSYFQPLLILVTVPMAFTGVIAGLVITGNPISLFTLYGVIALAGMAVNAAIVMVSAANSRLGEGMTLIHATTFAARRRVIPILITSTTTIAGLFSLATGLGGESLLWGPVAIAIVWGLLVSTVLTLFVVPILYAQTMCRSWRLPS